MKFTRKRTFTAAAIVAFVALAGTGSAVIKNVQGTTSSFFQAATETTAQTTNSVAWVTLPGASIATTISSPNSRTINSRFTAESQCTGTAPSQYCSVRIVARNTADNAIIELHPASSSDYAFDSVANGDDFWEGNAMERSRALGPGSYRIEAQWRVSSAPVNFRLDDWHFMMQSYGEPPVP